VTALLLTPGASANRDSPALVAIERAVAPDGVIVERIDLPGTRVERAAAVVTEAAAALAERAGCPLSEVYVGGRSFGGRACSLAVADGLGAAGLVLLSYPLHPPGRPTELRTAHFPKLQVPCLFVSGTRDAFATPAELESATAAIPGAVTHVWVEGGNHGMRGKDAPVAAAVREWLAAAATRPARGRARKAAKRAR
jgi:predicted alpha/beta-hydrolase family hydrolase